MITGCIDRMRRDGCGSCERREACASLLKRFGVGAPSMNAGGGADERSIVARRNPFLAFLGEVAKAVEAGVHPKRSGFRREVERAVEPLLASGDVGMERVARELGYSRQTLYRRLRAESLTFERLLAALRRRLALRFIRDEGLSVKETAYRLGFSDPAAFSRAFKRWTGSSPRAMRR